MIDRRAAASRKHYESIKVDSEKYQMRVAATARWRANNIDAVRDYERRYRQANAEAFREKNQRRRARLLDAYVAPVSLSEIWLRDGGICGICNAPIDISLSWPHTQSLTLDHVLALANGGTHEPDNVQIAHASCNSSKGARPELTIEDPA